MSKKDKKKSKNKKRKPYYPLAWDGSEDLSFGRGIIQAAQLLDTVSDIAAKAQDTETSLAAAEGWLRLAETFVALDNQSGENVDSDEEESRTYTGFTVKEINQKEEEDIESIDGQPVEDDSIPAAPREGERSDDD